MRRLKLKYLIPAVMACALFAGAPKAHAAFLFFGDDTTRPVISSAEAQSLALGVVPGTIQNQRIIRDAGQSAYIYDVSYNGRVHTVTVDGNTGTVVADRIGHRGPFFPFSLF